MNARLHRSSAFHGARHELASAVMAAALVVAPGAGALAAGPPAAGDAYVYRLVNGYNKEIVGQVRHQVDRVDPDRVSVLVTPDGPSAGMARTEIYTKTGNWLRYPLESHGQKVEYEFASAYPAYVFPLDAGKTWSVRVKASVPGASRSRSVRVDGKVLGAERIRVPAGEFDTIKIRRFAYPDDADFFREETRITEVEWYAPALSRAVRTERRSTWLDLSQCGMNLGCDFHGDWDVLELVDAGPAQKLK